MYPVGGLELDNPVFQSIKREITSLTHKKPRAKTGAFLADQDTSRFHKLAAEALNAQTLGIGITAVFRTPQTFFMGH